MEVWPLDEFRITIKHELNYEREAQNLISMGENMAEFKLITVPQPVGDYSTRRVLTMDYVRGSKITKVGPIARLELDGTALAEELFRAYLKQVLVDGLFHADPHPGNVFLTSDQRIGLLDLGMVGHVTPGMQESLLHVLVGASLLMRVKTSFHLMGYPGLAILCFLGAAGGAIWLLINIFVSDQKRKSKPARQ